MEAACLAGQECRLIQSRPCPLLLFEILIEMSKSPLLSRQVCNEKGWGITIPVTYSLLTTIDSRDQLHNSFVSLHIDFPSTMEFLQAENKANADLINLCSKNLQWSEPSHFTLLSINWPHWQWEALPITHNKAILPTEGYIPKCRT